MAQTQEFIATGRRKTSVARIRMTAGSGKIDINGKSFEDYFPTIPLQNTVLQPLQVVKLANSYDLSINTTGGGATGQAGAARLGSRSRGPCCWSMRIFAERSRLKASFGAIRG